MLAPQLMNLISTSLHCEQLACWDVMNLKQVARNASLLR